MQGWPEFKAAILKRTGIDLNAYKERQMFRRISTLMSLRGADSFQGYLNMLQRNPDCMQQFLERLTINVSEFFRNPERFRELKERYLPQLLEGRQQIKAWSAGSAAGEEPYSVAIMLAENVTGQRTPVLATDLDQEALAEAMAGKYPADRLNNVPEDIKRRYFTFKGDFYLVRPQLKSKVRFKRHDLLRDPYESGFDLILCRNVVIYFTEQAKQKIYTRFAQALRPGGILFTGATEQIFQPGNYGLEPVAPFFYRRPRD
ncbi:MAG TPA: protein-glutamate O-methyltransferase CheR [bacterium]|nr:protein-glutamate O-methyltransferase CheR [bacterium]